MNLFVNLLQALNFGYLLTLLADQLGTSNISLVHIAEFRLHLHPSSSWKQLFHFKKIFIHLLHHTFFFQIMEHNDSNHDVDWAATPLPFFQIGQVWYRDQPIKIFSDSLEKRSPSQFYFEPLVLLDPKSITSRSHESSEKEFVQITIQMWNGALRSKVLERLRSMKSLKNVDIEEDNVSVLPFEEVQLVCKSGSIRLTDQPTSYARPKENLGFYLLCDESSSANKLAKDFRRNPEFTLNEYLQLKLECRGLSNRSGTDQTSSKRPTFSYFVSFFLSDDTGDFSQNNFVFLFLNYLYTASSASSVSKFVGETSSNQMSTNFKFI